MRTLGCVFMTAIFAGAAAASTPVWIDTDPSVARGGHEVDDGFALVQAFHSSALTVRGVSVVFGNAPLDEASRSPSIWSRISVRLAWDISRRGVGRSTRH